VVLRGPDLDPSTRHGLDQPERCADRDARAGEPGEQLSMCPLAPTDGGEIHAVTL